MNTHIIAIRHGQTTSNEADQVSGGYDDPELTVAGINKALQAHDRLRDRVHRVYSSPKQRCVATGRLVFGLAIPPEQRLVNLNERYYGRFDGGPNDDWKAYMDSLKPEMDGLSETEKRQFRFEDGVENEADLIKRSLGAMTLIAAKSNGEHVGIATSGGILRGVLLGCGYDLPTGAIDNLAQLELEHDGTQAHVISTYGVHFAS